MNELVFLCPFSGREEHVMAWIQIILAILTALPAPVLLVLVLALAALVALLLLCIACSAGATRRIAQILDRCSCLIYGRCHYCRRPFSRPRGSTRRVKRG